VYKYFAWLVTHSAAGIKGIGNWTRTKRLQRTSSLSLFCCEEVKSLSEGICDFSSARTKKRRRKKEKKPFYYYYYHSGAF